MNNVFSLYFTTCQILIGCKSDVLGMCIYKNLSTNGVLGMCKFWRRIHTSCVHYQYHDCWEIGGDKYMGDFYQ